MTDAGPDQIDGRTARLQRNRDAVLDAVLELFTEGILEPTAAEAAERSGVSLRSVYRYYEDVESLMRAAIAHSFQRNLPWYTVPGLSEGPLPDRIDRLVTARITLHTHVGAIARAAVLRSRTNAVMAEQLQQRFALVREQNTQMFAPEITATPPERRADLADAIDLVIGFDALEALRMTRGLPDADAHRIATFALTALLRGAGSEPQAQPPA